MFFFIIINLNEEKKVTCAWRDGVCCGGSLSLSVFVTINLKKERQKTGWVWAIGLRLSFLSSAYKTCQPCVHRCLLWMDSTSSPFLNLQDNRIHRAGLSWC